MTVKGLAVDNASGSITLACIRTVNVRNENNGFVDNTITMAPDGRWALARRRTTTGRDAEPFASITAVLCVAADDHRLSA